MSSVVCCHVCPELVGQLRKTLNKSLVKTRDISMLVEQLTACDNQAIVAAIFQEKLGEAEPRDVVKMFEVIDRILCRVRGKLALAFEPLLPGICRYVRHLLAAVGEEADVARLLTLRFTWNHERLFSLACLHEMDHFVRHIDISWPLSKTANGIAPPSCPICSQPPPKIVQFVHVDMGHNIPNVDEIFASLEGVPKMLTKMEFTSEDAVYLCCDQLTTSINMDVVNSKDALEASKRIHQSEDGDSGIESQASESSVEMKVKHGRRKVPSNMMLLRIKLRDETFERLILKKRKADDDDEGCSKRRKIAEF